MLGDDCVLKCRRCRLAVVNGCCIVGCHGNSDICPGDSLSTLWYISHTNMPDWIQEQVSQAHWTKGRLLCPKCAGRLGSFDFVSQGKCPCGSQALPPIHIQRCRVDVDKFSPKLIQKAHQREKVLLKMCETKEQACGMVGIEHAAGRHSETGKMVRNSAVHKVGQRVVSAVDQDGAHRSKAQGVRVHFAHIETAVAPARADVNTASTGAAPAGGSASPADTGTSYTANGSPSLAELTEDEGQKNDPSDSASGTGDEGESGKHQNLRTSGTESQQRPLVVADDDDSYTCTSDTNFFHVLEGLDVGNAGNAADRLRPGRQTKRERNRLKNIRKKQRRHDKWMKKQTEEDESLEEAEREGLICPVCLDLYYEPYLCQPCTHVFCDPCLRQVAKDNPSCTTCPLCRTVVISVTYSYQLSKAIQEFFPRHHEVRRRTERQTRYRSWPLPGVTGARAVWWRTVTSLTSHRGQARGNFDGRMIMTIRLSIFAFLYIFCDSWITGILVVCVLCYVLYSFLW